MLKCYDPQKTPLYRSSRHFGLKGSKTWRPLKEKALKEGRAVVEEGRIINASVYLSPGGPPAEILRKRKLSAALLESKKNRTYFDCSPFNKPSTTNKTHTAYPVVGQMVGPSLFQNVRGDGCGRVEQSFALFV